MDVPLANGSYPIVEAIWTGNHGEFNACYLPAVTYSSIDHILPEVCRVLLDLADPRCIPPTDKLVQIPYVAEEISRQPRSYRTDLPTSLFDGVSLLLQLAMWRKQWAVVRTIMQSGKGEGILLPCFQDHVTCN